MGLYELSVDPAHVAEAETLVSQETLATRAFPTLVMGWESRLFDQPWWTRVLLDYVIALPPLEAGLSFIPVRVAAFVGDAPTKYFYFGTEMNNTVPRLGPEMENAIAPTSCYQEFLIDDRSPVPYLKLIQATPRIYGNGPQDYYAPPIKVERYDGLSKTEHLADFFGHHVAGLPVIAGSFLTDPNHGTWQGSRFSGIRSIAILRQGVVVGLHTKLGRPDKEVAPPVVHRRDPKLDIRGGWVAIDVGAKTFTVARRNERDVELIRIGAIEPIKRAVEYENPAEVSFIHLKAAMKAWRERVVQPSTLREDVRVGFASAALHQTATTPGLAGQSVPPPPADPEETFKHIAATITELPLVREWTEAKIPYRFVGVGEIEGGETLKQPAPPVIDEEGIGAHDPFDPVELYGYYIGLVVNHRSRGIHVRYLVTMPTGWSADRRQTVLVALRRGLYRSLPAGMVEYHDLEGLIVEDAGPAALCFLAHAVRAFSVSLKEGPIFFGCLDMGASETGMAFGHVRDATPEERRDGHATVIEHLPTEAIPWFGAERLLHRLAHRAAIGFEEQLAEHRIPFEPAPDESPLAVAGELLVPSPLARANKTILKELLRPVFEGDPVYRLPTTVRLGDTEGKLVEVRLSLSRAELKSVVDAWFAHGIGQFKAALSVALQKLGRGADPHEGLRIFLGGRMSMNNGLFDQLSKSLPSNVKVHRFREPDRTNLTAPTVKTATANGALAIKLDKIHVVSRGEQRDAFRYRVGRPRHGQLADVLDPGTDYDEWREAMSITKPTVDLLYMRADDDGEVAADDPRVVRVPCDLGPDAVGKRLFMRAVTTQRIELAVCVPGEDPQDSAEKYAVSLKDGMIYAL